MKLNMSKVKSQQSDENMCGFTLEFYNIILARLNECRDSAGEKLVVMFSSKKSFSAN